MSDRYRAQSIDEAASILQEHGFVIFASGMNTGDLKQMSSTLSNNGVRNPRGHVQSMAHWTNAACMACFTTASNVIKVISDVVSWENPSLRDKWTVSQRGLGGNVCLGRTLGWQDLHSDWPQLPTMWRDSGLPLACCVAPEDIGLDGGPIRAYSWKILPEEQIYHQMPFSQESITLDPLGARLEMIAGEALLRDVRVAHAGCPNLTDQDRVLPAFQIEGPALTSFY